MPVVSDHDDAVFHRYDRHRLAPVRRLLGRKIDGVMAASALVTAGNAYLAARARAAGAPRVEVVPTVLDGDRYGVARRPGSGRPVIGWMGSPSSWRLAEGMARVVSGLVAEGRASALVVGAGPAAEGIEGIEARGWREDREVADIQAMDVGIMPLEDTPFARGKCAYKLIQYMACGLPVVASPVGMNAEVVRPGVNGFLATTEAEWRRALEALVADPGLRRRMGEAGRREVERRYTIQVEGPRVAALLRDAALRARGG